MEVMLGRARAKVRCEQTRRGEGETKKVSG